MAKRKKVKIFGPLKESLTEALAYERGQSVDLRVTELPPAPKPISAREIRAIRLSLNASQALFARFLNVSTGAVESWEQGVRHPQKAALKLLTIAQKRPELLARP